MNRASLPVKDTGLSFLGCVSVEADFLFCSLYLLKQEKKELEGKELQGNGRAKR